jgi:hypothetical protein
VEAGRGFLYDAIRIGASDGPLTPDELDQLHGAAEAMGFARELVAELCAIVAAEQSLRRHRYEIVAVPAFGLDPRSPRPLMSSPGRPHYR